MSNSRFIQWKESNPSGYDDLLRRRRTKYADSEEARKRQLGHNANWREKQRQKKSKQRKSHIPKPRQIEIGGATVECWSVGHVASYLGVSKQTISNLEDNGSIPTNHFLDSNRRRWWPASFVHWLSPFFNARFEVGISAQEFHRRVWTGWTEEQMRGVVPVVGALATEDTGGRKNPTQGRKP